MEKWPRILEPTLGAIPDKEKNACYFRVWSPMSARLWLEIYHDQTSVELLPLQKNAEGYHFLELGGTRIGAKYYYRLNELNRRPDPVSRFQPAGVFGPSEVVSPEFPWTDEKWSGLNLKDYIIYELHVGLYTAEGTFGAIIPYLPRLRELGITAIELMPIAQFSGRRNWGYDSVFPFAVQNSYGGPGGLRQLVNACHEQDIAVILDVIYNHVGPEGSYFGDFAPYFTTKYKTPWGNAVNFDNAYSHHVRRYFIENALHWLKEYHIDGLRLDAVQEITDMSAYHFLAQLTDACEAASAETGRLFHLIAESNLNDVKLITPRAKGGYALHGQWNDDFHHALHALITGEKNGYYEDFGKLHQLVQAYQDGFVYSGQYSPFRRRHYGSCAADVPAWQLIVFAQNHDQVGNHYDGQRFTRILFLQQLKLIAAILLLSPYVPLIFMGEEYAETAPFHYFIDFTDKDLIAAVRKGRTAELIEIGWKGEIPDPQDESIFNQCKLQHYLKEEGDHKILWDFYKTLLLLRKTHPVLNNLIKEGMEVIANDNQKVMLVKRVYQQQACLLIFNFNHQEVVINTLIPKGKWQKLLSTIENDNNKTLFQVEQENLILSPYAFILFESVCEALF